MIGMRIASFFVTITNLSIVYIFVVWTSVSNDNVHFKSIVHESCKEAADLPAPVKREENAASYLYTRHGNSHLPLEILKDEHLAPLTRWTQTIIYKHQHPTDCDKVKFLITDGWDSGFGSEMHVVGSHLAYAIENNLVLVWGHSSCKRFVNCTQGCACLYRELSNCSSSVDFSQWNTVRHSEFNNVIPGVFKNAMISHIPSVTDHEMRYWWRAQSVGFIMRLNDETVEELSVMRQTPGLQYMSGGQVVPFPLPSGTVNAHIRHGDKFMEMTLVPSEAYAQAFTSMIQNMPNSFSRMLFVSSDDQKAINTCRELVENQKMTYIYTNISRMGGGHQMSEWDRSRNGMQRKIILGHILQLFMALEADAWIGTRGSNWNRLIDELRCVWIDKCQNMYVEVGTISQESLGYYNW